MKIRKLFHTLHTNEHIRRVFHTVWESAAGAFFTYLVANHSEQGIKIALTAAFAAALAALKAALVS